MAIDPHFIPAFSIETVILDKDTRAPLSGGQVTFYQDAQRGIFKPVYQITGTYPTYTYTPLPNPMTLSSIGTFEDSLGNPVVPYFYPYVMNDTTEQLDVQLYYVVVESFLGVQQFVRQAVPFIPDSGSTSVQSIITNEISNPQFAQVLFDTTTASTYTYTFSAVTEEVVHIAPDWDLIVTCPTSGSVTVGQLDPTGTQNIPTNPATILTIASAGITTLLLRQRLFGSPNLWGNGSLSASFIAKTFNGTDVVLGLFYSQSAGTITAQPIVMALLPASGAYQAFPGSLTLPLSDNTQSFPGAYVDIYFDLPTSIEIAISSVIVSGTADAVIDNIIYDQVPVSRQIDQLYHYAYPIVPIGTIIDFGGFTVPLHYLICDGSAISRINYYLLFQALTTVETVTLTSMMNTFTVVSSANYSVGMAIEGTGIPANTTISMISGTTITMSNAATVSGSEMVRFFAWGHGDGSTTFNVPSLSDFVLAGSGGTIFGANSGPGLKAGAASVSLTTDNLPAHVHPPADPYTTFWCALPAPVAGNLQTTLAGNLTNFPSVTGPNDTAHTNVSIVQQTALVKKCIRFE